MNDGSDVASLFRNDVANASGRRVLFRKDVVERMLWRTLVAAARDHCDLWIKRWAVLPACRRQKKQ